MRGEAEIGRLATRLPGRRAFITGAASGLGRAFALALARHRRPLGPADLSADRLEGVRAEVNAVGGRATIYTGDVASHDFVESMLQRYAREVGGVGRLLKPARVPR